MDPLRTMLPSTTPATRCTPCIKAVLRVRTSRISRALLVGALLAKRTGYQKQWVGRQAGLPCMPATVCRDASWRESGVRDVASSSYYHIWTCKPRFYSPYYHIWRVTLPRGFPARLPYPPPIPIRLPRDPASHSPPASRPSQHTQSVTRMVLHDQKYHPRLVRRKATPHAHTTPARAQGVGTSCCTFWSCPARAPSRVAWPCSSEPTKNRDNHHI